MGNAYFYHLTRRPMEETLIMLLCKAQDVGWRVAIRSEDHKLLSRLDEYLWKINDFLPHGLAGGQNDANQPILLTLHKISNYAKCLMSVDGTVVDPEEVKSLERVCILFDGEDPDQLRMARNQWRSLKDAAVPSQYWSEQSGSWEKRAEA